MKHLTDSAILSAYRAAIEDARTAPKTGFGSYGQNAVFAPANKAIELREEIERRRLGAKRVEENPT
jgi:hypothetical protein